MRIFFSHFEVLPCIQFNAKIYNWCDKKTVKTSNYVDRRMHDILSITITRAVNTDKNYFYHITIKSWIKISCVGDGNLWCISTAWHDLWIVTTSVTGERPLFSSVMFIKCIYMIFKKRSTNGLINIQDGIWELYEESIMDKIWYIYSQEGLQMYHQIIFRKNSMAFGFNRLGDSFH